MRFRTALKASNSNKLMSCIGRAQAGRPRTIVLAASQPIHTFLPEYGVIVAKGFAPLHHRWFKPRGGQQYTLWRLLQQPTRYLPRSDSSRSHENPDQARGSRGPAEVPCSMPGSCARSRCNPSKPGNPTQRQDRLRDSLFGLSPATAVDPECDRPSPWTKSEAPITRSIRTYLRERHTRQLTS